MGHLPGPYYILDLPKVVHLWRRSITELHIVIGAEYTMVSKADSVVIGDESIKSLFWVIFGSFPGPVLCPKLLKSSPFTKIINH